MANAPASESRLVGLGDTAPPSWIREPAGPRPMPQSKRAVSFGVAPRSGGVPGAVNVVDSNRLLGKVFANCCKALPALVVALLATTFLAEPVAAQAARNVICNGCVGSKDIKNNGIRSSDIKNGQVKRADIANSAVNSARVADDSLTADDLATDAVTEDEIADVTRSVSQSARALAFNPDSTVVQFSGAGLLWQQNSDGGARLTLLKPFGYAGGDVVLRILFNTTTATAGTVDFFIRPLSVDNGDELPENFNEFILPVGAPGVDVLGGGGPGSQGKLYEQTFTIPADRLGKEWWTSFIQRAGGESTYTDDIIVMAVALEYQATQ